MELRVERVFGVQGLGWSPMQVEGTNMSPWWSWLPLAGGRATLAAAGCEGLCGP